MTEQLQREKVLRIDLDLHPKLTNMMRGSAEKRKAVMDSCPSMDEECLGLTSSEQYEKSKPPSLLIVTPRGILMYAIFTASFLQTFSIFYSFRSTPEHACTKIPQEQSTELAPYVSKTASWKSVDYFSPIELKPDHEPSCCEIEGCEECDRQFLVVHKMGHDLTTKIKRKFFEQVGFSYPAPFTKEYKTPGEEYRHVFLTRNLYDALLSGYLFHKRGSECFDEQGNPIPGEEGWLYHRGDQWEDEIRQVTRRHDIRWPAAAGRHLCTYLAEESERDGLRVWVEWIYLNMLRDLVSFMKQRRDKEVAAGVQKTLHVCFEDLSGEKYESLVKEMGDFLYPYKEAIHLQKPPSIAGAGSHGTTKDTTVRDRLRGIIAELDYELFDGLIGFNSNDFGCGRHERV